MSACGRGIGAEALIISNLPVRPGGGERDSQTPPEPQAHSILRTDTAQEKMLGHSSSFIGCGQQLLQKPERRLLPWSLGELGEGLPALRRDDRVHRIHVTGITRDEHKLDRSQVSRERNFFSGQFGRFALVSESFQQLLFALRQHGSNRIRSLRIYRSLAGLRNPNNLIEPIRSNQQPLLIARYGYGDSCRR